LYVGLSTREVYVLEPHNIAALIRGKFSTLGYAFFEGKWDLNLIGLRSASDDANLFDDTFLVLAKNDANEWVSFRWACTTDPGRAWLAKPSRVEGCAIVVPGQYRGLWKKGLHKGEKPALVQAKPIKIWRDADKDNELDRTGKIIEGIFGINCHRAGKDSPLVELWSAGCQVFKRETDFLQFLEIVDKQVAAGHGDTFSYTLLDVGEHQELAQLLLAA
jgi:hypothetical protein